MSENAILMYKNRSRRRYLDLCHGNNPPVPCPLSLFAFFSPSLFPFDFRNALKNFSKTNWWKQISRRRRKNVNSSRMSERWLLGLLFLKCVRVCVYRAVYERTKKIGQIRIGKSEKKKMYNMKFKKAQKSKEYDLIWNTNIKSHSNDRSETGRERQKENRTKWKEKSSAGENPEHYLCFGFSAFSHLATWIFSWAACIILSSLWKEISLSFFCSLGFRLVKELSQFT